MRKLVFCLLALFIFALPVSASTIVVGFDDLPTTQSWSGVPNAWDPVPTNYAGLTWNGWAVINHGAYQAIYGDPTPFPSGDKLVFNDNGAFSVSVSSGTFDFVGAMFSGWPSTSYGSGSVTITGFLGGAQVGQLSSILTPTGFTTLGGLNGVDQLVFNPSADGKYFRMENFTYSTVPEPSTLLLLSGGLGAVGIGAIRKKPK
jgi:hypothetical protein